MTKTVALLLLIGFLAYPQLASAACSQAASASELMAQRQLTALRAMERGRGCKGDSGGGLFNACRDLSVRIAEVQRQISAGLASRSCSDASSATQSARVDRPKAATVTAKTDDKSTPSWGGKGALTYCVRLSDGYLFPAPHSQFDKADSTSETLAQCRFICQNQNVDLYVLSDPNGETADMISATSGKSYVDLPTAYNYQGSGDFQKCDWAGYVAKVSELRSSNRSAKAMRNVVMPMPDNRPARNADTVDTVATAAFAPLTDRTVRVVGPAFIFDESLKN
ncbi:DUF2865 domain-containing protein [Ochrobactrum sp. Kaboul]|nr:DUF2865 domain-containing protein [Ochrobactrum sp. Kaboul]